MARHDDQQRPRRGELAPGASSIASSPSRVDAATTTPRPRPARQARPRASSAGSAAMSYFRLPTTLDLAHAGVAQARGVGVGLRQRRGQALERRPQQRVDAPAAASAALAHARVGEQHRHAARRRDGEQVRPDLGFHQHADRRIGVAQEAAHRAGHVERQPELRVARRAASACPAARPVAVPWVSRMRAPGRAARRASSSGAAARVSPSETACTQIDARRHRLAIEAEPLAERAARRAARAGRAIARAAGRAARPGAAAASRRRAPRGDRQCRSRRLRIGMRRRRAGGALHALPRRPHRGDGRHRLAFDRDLAAAAVARLRAGSPRGREVVELDVRQAERDGDVARPAVDADRAVGRREAIDERAELERRPDGAVAADRRGDRARALAFLAARLRQRDRPAFVGEAPAELDPVRLGPELVGARRAVDRAPPCAAAPCAGDARADSPNDGGASMRVPSAAATSSRARSSAWLCGSTRIAFDTSQRAGASWLAPSVRLARP